MFRVLVLVQLFVVTSSHWWFRDRIPNGHNVPSPCKGGGVWNGVGHRAEGGGGPRNPFGLAFLAAGTTWTKALCEADTDGDGKTNGAELGDPSCTWTPTNGKTLATPTGHPGVCEPVDSASCKSKNTFEPCPVETVCEGRDESKTDISKVTLTFDSGTVIPSTTTNYYCKMFDLPDATTDYHITADKSRVGNYKIVHHMLLYGCPDNVDLTAEQQKFGNKPAECGMMVQEKCSQIIAGWSAGQKKGDCYDGLKAATRIGKTGFKKAILEVHWNNEKHLTNEKDSSGFDIYYSSKLREFDLGVLTVGPTALSIPPNQLTWWEQGRCRAECIGSKLTSNNRDQVYIVSAGLHMHLIGKSADLRIRHGNGTSTSLARNNHFDYNTPADTDHYPAVPLTKTDELILKCVFNSKLRRDFTYYGPATADEMCYSYLTYYPKLNDFTLCLQYGSTAHCNGAGTLSVVDGCSMSNTNLDNILWKLEQKCDMTGQRCLRGCRRVMRRERCFNRHRDGRKYLEYILGDNPNDVKYVKALRSCDKWYWNRFRKNQ